MRIIFCDDDMEFISTLRQCVEEFCRELPGRPPEYAVYSCGEDMLREESTADIAFLDVELSGISGIQAGARLKEQNPRIKIFIVTSYPEYLDDAMRFQVFRYLSKPIDRERLFRNLRDAVYQYNMETCEIPVITHEGVRILQADEIVCVESENRKTYLYTAEERLQVTEGIDRWQKKLDLPCFYSPYRGVIINMRHVRSFTRDTIRLRLGSGEKEAYLAKRKYSDFKSTYLLYRESIK